MVLVKSIKKFTAKLNKTQQKAMNRHARHHSLKHMKEMAKDLESGEDVRTSTYKSNAESRQMNGFTTTATISELIGKRPIRAKRKRTRKNKMPYKGSFKAVQRLLRIKRVKY